MKVSTDTESTILILAGLFIFAGSRAVIRPINPPQMKRSRWPIADSDLIRIGQSVMADRGNGQPHKGVDLFAKVGSPVRSTVDGSVVRVVDGRTSSESGKRRAGLWVDLKGDDGHVYRFLHLSSATVSAHQKIAIGDQIGAVGLSGITYSDPHLHYEIRMSDWNDKAGSYGEPVDPTKENA